MTSRKPLILWALTLYVGFVFIQSLFYKYTYSPETAHIFGTLDAWAESAFGLGGLFGPRGLFSAYVIGTAELFASGLLLGGLMLKKPLIHAFGALMGLGVISGAIIFHLFTPLGVVIINEGLGVESDHGLLFTMACGVWIANAAILFLRKDEIAGLIGRLRG